jgi:hypothetical protein
MKPIKILTFAALAATLLVQTPTTQADDHGQRGDRDVPSSPFVILLKGIYQPVGLGHGPKHNLGLSQVNLSDGTYSKTKIYGVSGLPEADDDTDEAIGNFYVQFAGNLCAYQIPGGTLSMTFTGGGFTDFVPDGLGGTFLIGTFELTILEGNGIYRSFAGGHNHMVDVLHLLADGRYDEDCYCNISRP